MQTPMEVAFRNVEATDDLKDLIAEKADHLDNLFDGITSCHVIVHAPHHSHRKGNLIEVTIEVRVPGDELVVRHHQQDVAQHEHARVAIRDAFSAMTRKLNRWKAAISGEVKFHDGPLQGRIADIRHDKGFGQIIATDHRLIYFHKNSVVGGDFASLQPRDTVELVVQTDESDIGPQASTVRKIGTMAYDPAVKKKP